jgi:hypothetical protein
MQEPYVCKSSEECMQVVGQMLGGESGEASEEQSAEGYGQMWEQEAANRKPQPGLMA